MKNSTFKLIVALIVLIIALILIESCKTKHKLVSKTETLDKSLITKSDSAKVIVSITTSKQATDTTKKTHSYTKESTGKTYTEIEIEMDTPTGGPDTSGNAAKGLLVNDILNGAKKIKIKIWDYQNKKASGEKSEQAGLSENSNTAAVKDSSALNKSSDQKNIKNSSNLSIKDKDSTAKANWIGWVIGIPAAILALWLVYKGYLLLRK